MRVGVRSRMRVGVRSRMGVGVRSRMRVGGRVLGGCGPRGFVMTLIALMRD